jgi:hypothetical protein
MASTVRARATATHGFIDKAVSAEPRRQKVVLSHLVDELVIAFFVAMAAMWLVTTVAGIFS